MALASKLRRTQIALWMEVCVYLVRELLLLSPSIKEKHPPLAVWMTQYKKKKLYNDTLHS